MVDVRRHPVLINNVLAAINAATARAQYKETAAFQAAEARVEGESEEGTAVEVHPTRRGMYGGQAATQRAKAEELALLTHHTPITCSLMHDYWMSSGRMCC